MIVRTKHLRISPTLLVTLFAAMAIAFIGVGLTEAQVVPPQVHETLAPGQSVDISKTVATPPIPPNPDICFLADTTGSMGPAIANVQANATSIMNTVVGSEPNAQFCAGEYRDVGDDFTFRINEDLTSNVVTIQTAINGWAAAGGGDTPEAQIPALHHLANNVSWRVNSTPVIVWFGDASGHDPRAGISLNDAITALQSANVTVLAVPVDSGFGDGLDAAGQATAIANATGGQVLPGATPDQLSQTILNALSNLPITVTPLAIGCAPLNVSFSPTSQTVTSGQDAHFTEKISVPNDSDLAGQTINCSVDFQDGSGNSIGVQQISVEIPLALDAQPDTDVNELFPGNTHDVNAVVTSNGIPLDGLTVNFNVSAGPNAGANESDVSDGFGSVDFTYTAAQGLAGLGEDIIDVCVTGADGVDICDTVNKEWVDTTPPAVACTDSVNPAGNTPNAPGEGGQGQNQDGFFVLTALDIVDPEPSIYLVDIGTDNTFGTADDFTFGPFSSPTNVKYTEANGATPDIQPGSGDVDWRINGQGDAAVYATDSTGNISAEVRCLVPPPPK